MAKTKVQTRRSISVRGELYEQIHDYCEKHNISMSSFVENRISSFLNGLRADEQPPLPVTEDEEIPVIPAAPVQETVSAVSIHQPPPRTQIDAATLAEEIRQHFTF